MNKRYTLSSLAELFSVRLVGNGDVEIHSVSDLEIAGEHCIAFYADKKFRPQLETTNAGAVIIEECNLTHCKRPALLSDSPYTLFAEIAALLHPDEDFTSGRIDVSASVHDTVKLGDGAIIAANAVIEEGCQIGNSVYIGPGCVLKQRVHIGSDSKLVANVTICRDCRLGERVIVHPAAVIGSDGFGLARKKGRWIKIPQLGSVVIGNDVEIGAGVAIDRGALRDTVIEDGVKLDNQIHVAHNVVIGANTAMAAQSGIAGSTRIGKDCAIAGAVGMLGHLEIADNSRINAFSSVYQSISEPGVYASGMPVEPVESWRKNRVRFKQLNEMARRIKHLEQKLKQLEERK